MTTVYLVRHGSHDRLGRFLDGRTPGVHLSKTGEREAGRLAARLSREQIEAIYSSPLERAQATAAPIAVALGLAVQVEAALNEIDFGEWSGCSFEALKPLESWQRWNATRSTAQTPAGDTMRAAQTRLLDFIDQRRGEGRAAFIMVSHADPLKAVVAYYLGLSLDDLQRFEIAPASLSRIEIEPWAARVSFLNETQTSWQGPS